MIVIIVFLLAALLGIVPIWIAELIQKHPAPMPPATDADEEADALPFGPATPNVD